MIDKKKIFFYYIFENHSIVDVFIIVKNFDDSVVEFILSS